MAAVQRLSMISVFDLGAMQIEHYIWHHCVMLQLCLAHCLCSLTIQPKRLFQHNITCRLEVCAIMLCSTASFGRDPHLYQKEQQDSNAVELLNHPLFQNQMLAVMVLCQHRMSTSKTVSPHIPVGA